MPTAPWQYRIWPVSLSDLLLLVIVLVLGTWFNGGLAGLFFQGGMPLAQVVFIHVAIQVAMLFVLVRAVAIRWRGLTWPELGLTAFDSRQMVIGILMGILAFFLIQIVWGLMHATQEEELQNPQESLLRAVDSGSGASFLTILLLTTLVPVVEELGFRGLIYGWLRQRLHIWPSVLVSSVFFAAMHDAPLLLLPLTVAGILLALLYEHYRSIWPCVFAHGTLNGITLTVF